MIFVRWLDKQGRRLTRKLPNGAQTPMILATACGSPLVVGWVMLLIIIWSRNKHGGQYFSLAVTLTVLLALPLVIKRLAKRARPAKTFVGTMGFESYSFPSGHSYGAVLAYGLLIFLSPALWVKTALVGLILVIGISRVYLGVHFMSDVVAGWLLGIVILSAALLIY